MEMFKIFFTWLLAVSFFFSGISTVSEVPRILLNHGYKIPAIGYGTWMANGQDLEKALEVALEAGYRYIDTASFYGNEIAIGNVLHRWITGKKLKREELFILTKLPPIANRPEGVEKYLKKSLENLQLDFVDMYLIHVPFAFKESGDNMFPLRSDNETIDMDTSTDIMGVWKEMEKQVRNGLTRGIGISNFNKTQTERLLKNCWIKPSVLQIELNSRLQQNELVEFCRANNILIIAYSPLGSPGLGKLYGQLQKKIIDLPNLLGDPTLKTIAAKYSKTTAQILLRFCVQIGVVPIPKSINSTRIKMNIDIFDFQLNEEDMNKIKALDENRRILNFSELFKGIERHPEYPFNTQ